MGSGFLVATILAAWLPRITEAQFVTKKETDPIDLCELRISDFRAQSPTDELTFDVGQDFNCEAYGELACLFCECRDEWGFVTGEDDIVSCELRGEAGVTPVTEHKSEESGGIILDEGTVVDRILGVWQVGRDTEDYSLFDARLFRAQGDDENGLTLGFDSDPDPNEVVLLAKIGYGDSFKTGSDNAFIEGEFETEAGAEGGASYSQGVIRRYAEVGAEVSTKLEAVVESP